MDSSIECSSGCLAAASALGEWADVDVGDAGDSDGWLGSAGAYGILRVAFGGGVYLLCMLGATT